MKLQVVDNFFDNFITSREFPYVMSINNIKNNVTYIRPSGTVNLLSRYLFANKFAELITLLYDPKFDGINELLKKNNIKQFDKEREKDNKATYTDLMNEILKIFGPIDEPNLKQTTQRYINFSDMMKVYDTYTYTPIDAINANSFSIKFNINKVLKVL